MRSADKDSLFCSPTRTREVVLPKFKLEQNYDLIANLKEMGVTDLFQENGDFSGMTDQKVSINWVSPASFYNFQDQSQQ